jgi:hypothetical protein
VRALALPLKHGNEILERVGGRPVRAMGKPDLTPHIDLDLA